MKKVYEKPIVIIENFEVSQSIAACGWDVVNSGEPQVCGAVGDSKDFNNEPVTIFQNNPICEVNESDLKDWGFSYCYMTSQDAWRVFNS